MDSSKKLLLQSIFVFSLLTQLQAQIPDNYIAYWSFDGNVSESPDIATDPVSTNTYGKDRFGIDLKAIYFDGNDNLRYNPTPTQLNDLPAGDFSISMWIKDENQSGLHAVLSAFHSGSGYILRTGNGTFGREINFNIAALGSNHRSDDGIIPDQWQHHAMTYSVATKAVKLYIDGIEVSYDPKSTGSGNYAGDGYDFQIGAISTNLQGMIGYLDDLYIYDYVLTEQQITDLSSDNAGGGTNNALVAHWPLYENAEDEGPNGYDGVSIGASPTNGNYSLDGSNDYIDLSNPFGLGNLPLNDFNISVWVNDEQDGDPGIIYASSSSQDGWFLGTISDGAGGRIFRMRVFFNQGDVIYKTTEPFPASAWVHVSVNYSAASNTIQVFVNGVESTVQDTISGTLDVFKSDANANKYIGNLRPANPEFFKGSIKDLYLYNRVLTESEIQSLAGLNTDGTSLWQVAETITEGQTDIYYQYGNVGVGTPDTRGYEFAVAGKILAEEVKVQLQDNWPDYVFEETYELPSLKELEAYIQTHRHLPNVPSEAEVKAEGIELGEMNSKLLQKIEELTLHMIEMNKRLEALEKENKMLKTNKE